MPSQHGDGHQQVSCATGVPAVPLAKKMRRAFRAAVGMPKPKKKQKRPGEEGHAPAAASVELVSSSSCLAAARKEEVVRVVLRGGVVEVYPGVVQACTVIRNHPPGLCLAHPDVFRNPHGAVVRPLEPLFPGQKFLLVPWTTVVKLKHKIPESSVGAFEEDEEEEEGTGSDEEEEATSTETEEASGEEEDGAAAACSARAFFVDRDRWTDCRFKRLVELRLAVEPSKDDDEPERKDKAKKKAGKKKKKKPGKRRRPVPLSAVGLRALATPRRTWEPSLPAVAEEENVSPLPPRPPSSESEETIRVPDDHHDQ